MAGCDRPRLSPILSPPRVCPPGHDLSPQYLCVDETKRPRANSDPVGLHYSPVPEIKVTAEDGQEESGNDDDETDTYLIPPPPRRRANTCPEDMFLARRERPPTPPPTDIHILKSPAGKRFSFNFTAKDLNGISFAHHKLSKVREDTAEQQQEKEPEPTSSTQLPGASGGLPGCLNASGGSTREDRKSSRLQEGATGPNSQVGEGSSTSCDQSLNCSLKSMSLNGQCQTAASSSKDNNVKDKPGSSDVIKCSPDTWRANDKTRDSVDSSQLRAY